MLLLVKLLMLMLLLQVTVEAKKMRKAKNAKIIEFFIPGLNKPDLGHAECNWKCARKYKCRGGYIDSNRHWNCVCNC
ncbi:unnamed protein product [Cylicocyclus nassatus]|uniref:Uncharacterized protein n=1 Tax=Cylicocyclus nassatus TaxID=53992 RepID=A0AA36MC75_CYLNA|nr:unnamed protein product [Cylicocyclus nassatus]